MGGVRPIRINFSGGMAEVPILVNGELIEAAPSDTMATFLSKCESRFCIPVAHQALLNADGWLNQNGDFIENHVLNRMEFIRTIEDLHHRRNSASGGALRLLDTRVVQAEKRETESGMPIYVKTLTGKTVYLRVE